MNVTKSACDFCKRETSDRYAEDGWIQISRASVSVSRGRGKDGKPDSGFYSDREGDLDFCSYECLEPWLRSLK